MKANALPEASGRFNAWLQPFFGGEAVKCVAEDVLRAPLRFEIEIP